MMLAGLLMILLVGGDSEPLSLSLDDAVQLARRNNLTLQVLRLDAEAAVEAFNSVWGTFDTKFFTDATYDDTTSAPTETVVGGVTVAQTPATQTKFTQWRTGFSGMFMSGTSWVFDVGPQQIDTQNDDVETKIHTGDWSLALTHPLLRDGADDYAVSGLELAQADATIAHLAAEEQATETVRQVTEAYWNLVFARQNLGTRNLSVDLATELLDITRRKFEQGLQNRIDVTEVEAELAARREEQLQARTTEQLAEDEIRRLVLAPEDETQWSRPIELLTEPSPPQGGTLNVSGAIGTALENRADVAQAREQIRRADVEIRRAQNQTRPRLDLTGTYGINANENSYGDVYENLDDSSHDTLRVALAFEVSIGNRTAGYDLRRRNILRQRAGVSLREAELDTFAQVRSAVREVELQTERVSATAETTRLQREVYEGEVRRLENDLSTPFEVKQAQRDLLDAIDTETRARLDLEVARAGLLASQGKLLQAYGYERRLPELSLSDEPPRP